MADMVLFKIGSTDLTGYLDIQTFQMNKADVFDVWYDGNNIAHRNFSRKRITGKAVAGFSKAADFSTFCTLVESARQTDGYYNVTAYINNTGTSETFQAYIDITTTAKWDWVNNREWHAVTLTIEQR